MTPNRMTSYVLAAAGLLFLVASAIGGFQNLTLLALGFVFLAIGVAVRPRAPRS